MVGAAHDAVQREWAHALLARARTVGIHHIPRTRECSSASRSWDAFVLPSRADPFPISMLEAMASGLPVVGTRRDGIAEQIAAGTGLLIEPDDPGALADAIAWCAAQPATHPRADGQPPRGTGSTTAFTLSHQAAHARRLPGDAGERRLDVGRCVVRVPRAAVGFGGLGSEGVGSGGWQPEASARAAESRSHRVMIAYSMADPALRRDPRQLHVAVHDPRGDVVARGDVAGDAVGDGDRAVAAAGAADRDRQVGLALGDVGREQEVEQRQQAAVVLARQLARLDVLDHGGSRPVSGRRSSR